MKTAALAAAIVAALTLPADARAKRSTAAHPDCNVTMPCQDVADTKRGRELRDRLPIGEPVQRYDRRVSFDGANGAVRAMHNLVDQAAAAAGVPARIAHQVIRYESKYRPNARGLAGEYGLGQIKCQTARGVGFEGGCGELLDPATNLKFSMRYLRLALDRGGSGCAGISLYQRGVYARPGCTAYGRKVLASAAP